MMRCGKCALIGTNAGQRIGAHAPGCKRGDSMLPEVWGPEPWVQAAVACGAFAFGTYTEARLLELCRLFPYGTAARIELERRAALEADEPTVDPDAYCREHGCPRWRCDESHEAAQ